MAQQRWRVGERVTFLNEVGGGEVLALLTGDRIKVRTDDGFELDYPANALVRLAPGSEQSLNTLSAHQLDMVAANDKLADKKRKVVPKGKTPPRQAKAEKYPDGSIMEIDLHLHALVDNEHRMDPGEKLEYQVAYFERMLNTAIREKKRKLIAIHGVGEGKLREEVRKVLRFYEGVRFEDADPHRYGGGATEVHIPQKG